MVSNRITEGVGKKIVEALKQQSNIEIQHVVESSDYDENISYDNDNQQIEYVNEPAETQMQVEEPVYSQPEPEVQPLPQQQTSYSSPYENISIPPMNFEQPQTVNPSVMKFTQPSPQPEPVNELEGFEIPTNVAVLKQLITQLPSGVTKQTGALIIRQTMEALGISMKSVLQEAQQVQENLSHSARDCQSTIMEYKRQISVLEKQSHKFQRQYSALNDIISLFIQTNN